MNNYKREFSLTQRTMPGCTLPSIVRIAASAGYNYVSADITGLVGQPGLIGETKIAIEDTGVGIHDIELKIYKDTTDIRVYEPALDLGYELGAKYVLSSIWADEADLFSPIDRFGELCDLAAERNMDVRIEFIPWSSVRDLGQVQQAIRHVNRPNAGYVIDMLHAHYSRLSPEDLSCAWEGCLDFVYICDAPKEVPATVEEMIRVGCGAREYPGEGGIDIASYMEHVAKDAVCCLDVPNLAKTALGVQQHAKHCIKSARSYIAEHGL